jgi:hypothetical protein
MGQLTFFQPNPGPDRPCPICGTPRPHSPRYPDHVCAACVERAVDDDGRRLTFFNTSLLGGFGAGYPETGERVLPELDEQECLIDGVRCVAREARFGGIVVRPVPGATRMHTE